MRRTNRATEPASAAAPRRMTWSCDVASCDSQAESSVSIHVHVDSRTDESEDDSRKEEQGRPRGWIEREAPPRGTVLDLCSHHAPLGVTIDDVFERIPDTCRRIDARSSPPDLAEGPRTSATEQVRPEEVHPEQTHPEAFQHDEPRPGRALDVDDAPRIAWGAYLRAALATRVEDAAGSTEELTVLCLALAERVLALEAALSSATQMLQADQMPGEGDATAPSTRVRRIQIQALQIVAASTPGVLSALADRITAAKARRTRGARREGKKKQRRVEEPTTTSEGRIKDQET